MSKKSRFLVCTGAVNGVKTPLSVFEKQNYQMENTLNKESTQVKEEPASGTLKKEPISRCADLTNEFVDYTMVSVPISEITEMEDNNAFMDTIEHSVSQQMQKNKQSDPPTEAMDVEEVEENTDLQATSKDVSNLSSNETTPNTCDASTTEKVEVPPPSAPIEEPKEDANKKDDDDDVVMVLSDSDDEQEKAKTDTQISSSETVEKISNKEATSEVADVTLDNDNDHTKSNSTEAVESIDNSVIMLDDSPDNSEAETQHNNVDSSKTNSSETKGKLFCRSNVTTKFNV